jgi:hypothetical protein
MALAPSVAATMPVRAGEIVMVKYRGPVDLTPFACEFVQRSSLVQRPCYDRREQYVIVNLNGTYYHYWPVAAIAPAHAKGKLTFLATAATRNCPT